MIKIVVTVYQSAGGDRFKVHTADENDNAVEVTDQYEVVAMQTEDGRTGFAVIKEKE